MEDKLLEVKDLVVQFRTKTGVLTAVDHVSFDVGRQEVLGLVGESGCGKSVTSMSILRLNPKETTLIPEGEILFNGTDLLKLTDRQLRDYRGAKISMIFQDSLTGLDPVKPIGKLLVEAIRVHQKISKKEAWEKGRAILESVGIPEAERRMHEYAHQLSGGMRQRVMIAMALLHDSSLIIADEPTTALDVTIQSQILELLRKKQVEAHASIILITHDMGVVAENTDRVAVMYAGQIVETAPTAEIFANPQHPYTVGLLASIPRLNQKDDAELYTIPGTVPPLGARPAGCKFCNRCTFATEKCSQEEPPLTQQGTHAVRCWKYTPAGC